MPIARCTSSYSCKVELARRPNAGISYAGLHTACLTAAVDFDRPVKLLLVRAQEFLLPPIAVRAPRRSSRPANVTRLLPTQGPHIASSTAAVEIDRPVAHVLTRRHEEQHTQHMLSGRALRDVQSHRGSRTNGGGERDCVLLVCGARLSSRKSKRAHVSRQPTIQQCHRPLFARVILSQEPLGISCPDGFVRLE